MSIGKKLVIVLILILLALSGATYSYGVYYFTGHFLPGSTLNGWNCSYMDVEETEDLLSQEVKSYVLTINTKNNGQESITADQASL
jgi:hypothetical protein